MKELTSIEAVQHWVREHRLSFLYVSAPDCSVCHALLPQIREVLKEFPQIQAGRVDASKVTQIAGYLSVFTVPVLVLFVDGREALREARMVYVERFRDRVAAIYEGVLSSEGLDETTKRPLP